MNKKSLYLYLAGILLIYIPLASSAHFIVGIVNDALDGTSADGYEIVLWNPANGISDNVSDIIGPFGNSGASNIYFVDCEMLDIPCDINDILNIKVINNGSGYNSPETSVTVTGSGFDEASNLTLNSFPRINNVFIEDDYINPSEEIDLLPLQKKTVKCEGEIYDYEGDDSISNVSAKFYDNLLSFYSDIDDNNKHYSNNSCDLDISYGDSNQVYYTCSFEIEYYANSNYWNCTVLVFDNLTISNSDTNRTFINSLLALSIPSPIRFIEMSSEGITNETIINVTNAGNSNINLTLSGYARNEGDGYGMNCSEEGNISIEYIKYNLSASNSGPIGLTNLELDYINLTKTPALKEFNLDYRKEDSSAYLDGINSTYWRVYVPLGIFGNCTGNIIFGAVKGGES